MPDEPEKEVNESNTPLIEEETDDMNLICDGIEGIHAADVWQYAVLNFPSEMERIGFDLQVSLSEEEQVAIGFMILDICDE